MDVFIYALHCPIAKCIRYIGKTKYPQSRLAAHMSKARSHQTKHHCANWIRKLLAQGLQPSFEIIERVAAGDNWQAAEARIIAAHKSPMLTNMTAGGDGFHDVHPEVLKKRGASRSRSLQDPVKRALFLKATRASRDRPEVRAAMSASAIAAWKDPKKRQRLLEGTRAPDVRKRRSESAVRANAVPELKARQSAMRKRIWSTPERRSEASARSLAMHANPVVSAKRIISIKATYALPETKARLSAAVKLSAARPEVKAKRSVSSKAKWADPEYRYKVLNAPNRKANMSAATKADWTNNRELRLTQMNAPERCAKISAAMSKRNADPAFRAMVSGPEVRARAAATLKATWARRKAEAKAKQSA